MAFAGEFTGQGQFGGQYVPEPSEDLNFENRAIANERRQESQEILSQKNIELIVYQKRLGLSKEDILRITDQAKMANQHRGMLAEPFPYISNEDADYLFSLIRAVDERSKNFDHEERAHKLQIANLQKAIRDISQDNVDLRGQLAAKAKEMAEIVSKGAGTTHTLLGLQIQQLQDENAALEGENSKLHEYLDDLVHRNEVISQENEALRKLSLDGDKEQAAGSKQKSEETIGFTFQLKAAKVAFDQLAVQRDLLLKEASDYKAELENLKGQVRVLKSQQRALETQLGFMTQGENEIAIKAKARVEELQAEVSKWTEALREVQGERDTLEAKLVASRDEVLSLQERLVKIEGDSVELKKTLENLEDKNGYLKHTNDKLREELEAMGKKSQEVSKREGMITAAEDRNKELLALMQETQAAQLKELTSKYNTMLDNLKHKHSEALIEKDEALADLSRQLTVVKIKCGRYELENQELRDIQQRQTPLQSGESNKDLAIQDQEKKIIELQTQVEQLTRKNRDLELKKLQTLHGPGLKDEAYRKLEQELSATKGKLETLKVESTRLTETLRRKDRQLQDHEDEKLATMKKNGENSNSAAQEFLRELQRKDEELLEAQRKFGEYKSDLERKLQQHEQLEEQLLQHSRQLMRLHDANHRKLADENEELRAQIRRFEQALT